VVVSATGETSGTGVRIRVNPIACDAHGLCVELLPELIRLDDWGYPIIDDSEVPPELLGLARMAADACPTLAVLVERQGVPETS
jgi:ferredoxin